MDESPLHDRLSRIERLQYFILALVLVQLLVGSVERLGPGMTGLLGTMVGVVVFAMIVVSRRRNRTTARR